MPIRLDQIPEDSQSAPQAAPGVMTPPGGAPGALPPDILALSGMVPAAQPSINSMTRSPSGSSVGIDMGKSRSQIAQELGMKAAERELQNKIPVLTETERKQERFESTAVGFLDQFAQQLGIDPANGTVARADLMTAKRDFLPSKIANYAMNEEQVLAYNALDSAFQMGAPLLTGAQGDIEKLQNLRDTYSFGGAMKDKPQATVSMYQNLRRLFKAFDTAQAMDEGPEKSAYLSAALDRAYGQAQQDTGQPAQAGADPNLMALQAQFPGAKIRRKQ